MDQIQSDNNTERGPWALLSLLFIVVILSMFLFNFIGLVLALPLLNFDFNAVKSLLENPMSSGSTRVPLLFIQGIISFGTFIIAPYVFRKYLDLGNLAKLEFKPNDSYVGYALIVLFTFTVMPLSAKLIEWNQSMHFPSFLAAFENWARSTNDFVEASTNHLIDLDGPLELLLGLLVIAVIPAIGEEYLFRGFAQKYLIKALGNNHLGIISSAFLFAFFHMQIFMILPRFLLGIIYGYFYHYSKNLYISILAHFVNNAFMLIMVYLYNQGMINFNIDSKESMPILFVLISVVFSSILFFVFQKQFQNRIKQA